MLIATPVLRYRGGLNEEYSLTRIVMLRIAELLGDCTISSPASSFIHLVRESGMFPAGAGISERVGITGSVNGIQYSIEEMAVNAPHLEQDICLFKGLLLVCTPLKRSENTAFDTRRRLLLSHPELILPDTLTALFWDKAEYLSLPPLPGVKLSGISTHALQTQNIVSTEWLVEIQRMAAECASQPESEIRVDSRLIDSLQKILGKGRSFVDSRTERPALSAEKAYDAQFCAAPDMLLARQSESSLFSGEALFSAALLGDACIIAMPCPAAFFTTDSLFGTSFSNADARLLYRLVEWISTNGLPVSGNR